MTRSKLAAGELSEMNPLFEVMVVSSDLQSRRNLLGILSELDCEPLCVPGIQQAIELLGEVSCGLVFCDRNLSDGTHRELLLALRSHRIKARVVVAARLTDWNHYLDAMKLGAFDVINAPCRPSDVEWMLLQTNRDYRKAFLHSAGLEDHGLKGTAAVN
jgi:DNA-binding NtrC family response regulator